MTVEREDAALGAGPQPLRAGHGAPSDGAVFESLRFPQYRRLWISGVVVFLGVTAQSIARGWLARELTGTNAGLGAVLLAFGLPMLVATPWGGVAADRLSKRLVLGISVGLLAVSALWIGLAVALDVIEFWMLMAASGIQAVAFAIYGPARMAFITELVDDSAVSNAIVLGQMSVEGTRVVGPALAGVAIGAVSFGTEAVFLASAGLSLVSMAAVFTLPAGRPAAGRPARSATAELVDGMRYVRGHREVRLLVLTSLGVVMIGFPYMAFLPTVADEIYSVGSSGYGILSTVSAFGAVVAALLTARRAGRGDAWRVLALTGVAFGGSEVLLGLAPWYWSALVVIAVTGGAGLAFQTTNQSLLLSLSDFEYHGRIQGLVMLGFSGFGMAALPLGLLADAIGLRTTFVLMGTVVILVVLASAATTRKIRRAHPLDLG